MQLRMWMYDIAREQSPTTEHLIAFCELTRDAGYNAIGLYFEHRFAYPSTPWMHGKGAVTPEQIHILQDRFPDLQIIPFINLLGHFEGFLYTEEGRKYAEEQFSGMQACPSKLAFVELAEKIVDDTLAIFTSEIIHIGGDETWQLGKCPVCAAKVKAWEETEGVDGKARLYGEHFGPLSKRVAEAGRRPAVWGDMFLDHPQALDIVPKNTLIFDWQYFKSPIETSRKFIEKGFEVVTSPTIHTYNASWAHLPQAERNIRENLDAANELNAFGVCVTTWECGLMGNYETLIPAIRAAGMMLSGDILPDTEAGKPYEELREAPNFLRAYLRETETYEDWARFMGCDIQNIGGEFAFDGWRSSLKVRLLLYSNPFLAWLHHGEELSGQVGDKALGLLERALIMSPNPSARGVTEFVKGAIEFVRYAELAHKAYAAGSPGEATTHLAVCRQIFENITKAAKSTHMRIGGSLADIERATIAREHVERVIRRIKEYGDGSLGYLPSFEMITHPKFVPHDQAGWWLINDWANQ